MKGKDPCNWSQNSWTLWLIDVIVVVVVVLPCVCHTCLFFGISMMVYQYNPVDCSPFTVLWIGMLKQFVSSIRSYCIFLNSSSIIRNRHNMIRYWRKMNRCMPYWLFAFLCARKSILLKRMWIHSWGISTMRRWQRCWGMMMKRMLCMMNFSHMPAPNSLLHRLQFWRNLLRITTR